MKKEGPAGRKKDQREDQQADYLRFGPDNHRGFALSLPLSLPLGMRKFTRAIAVGDYFSQCCKIFEVAAKCQQWGEKASNYL